MNLYIITYAVYLLVSILITVFVAKVLFKNGRLFLIDIFHKNEPLADSVNKLLLVGFYLVNIGYITYTLKETAPIESYQVVVERLSLKVGEIILILGGMHFLNLIVFYKLRRRSLLGY